MRRKTEAGCQQVCQTEQEVPVGASPCSPIRRFAAISSGVFHRSSVRTETFLAETYPDQHSCLAKRFLWEPRLMLHAGGAGWRVRGDTPHRTS